MWVFTRYGFFSVVCAKNLSAGGLDKSHLMIRARSAAHLKTLKDRFSKQLAGCEISVAKDTDYPCRLIVARDTWTEISRLLADEIDYGNFKSEVARHKGNDNYEESLHKVWSVMRRFQDAVQE
jgi:hypothetical protein